MPDNLIPFRPPDADEHARAETERKQHLFDWADRVLAELGLTDRVRQAGTVDELRRVTFDANAADIVLAIRDALHPARGRKAAHFAGMNEGGLKKILKLRFRVLKEARETELRNGQTTAGSQSTHDWTAELKLDDQGGVRPILHNLILLLTHHAKWKGVVGYDEFSARVIIRKRPPFGDVPPDTPWSDHFETLTRKWFQTEDINANLGDVGRAVQAAARNNCFHPVREYLDQLVWDRTPRLDAWLVTYLHAEDTDYTRAIGPRWLISAVARIYQPSAQVDHMLVLEGPQGKLKSQALRALAIKDLWFTDRLSHLSSKDVAQEMAGVFLIELAELDAVMRAAASASKSFLTRRHDRFRPPYGKHPINWPRQCVFAGTINPPVGGYLKDPTGASRFWPVVCRGMIDRGGIERDCDQLWAEAVARYKADAKWWLETPALEALATAEQKARFKVDPWQPRVESWLGQRKRVRLSHVLSGALRIAVVNQSKTAQMRAANILTNLGFTKRRLGNHHREYWYFREES